MRYDYFSVMQSLIKAMIFKMRIPLAVSWSLTNRCNQRCRYCKRWEYPVSELNTMEIYKMVDEFSQLGTQWISFTGGEPLLREDIGKIIEYVKRKGIYVSISSNGKLVPERIKDLGRLDRIKLSLDGPREVNDYMRGQGCFDNVIKAIRLCQIESIPVRLEAVLSKYNLNSISYLVNLARKYKTIISFQPTTENLLHSQERNLTIPSRQKYQQTIRELIRLKRKGAPIYNSIPGLNHLYSWPVPRKIKCTAGYLNIDVEPDGTLLPCERFSSQFLTEIKGQKDENIKNTISNFFLPQKCQQCWCSSLVEFNLIMSFNIGAIMNFFKTY